MADSKLLNGFKWDPTNLWLEVWVNGTEVAHFNDGTNDLRITSGGLRVDSGGIGLATGALVSDDTTVAESGITGSIHTDGGLGIVMDMVAGTARLVGTATYADNLYHANEYSETITAEETTTAEESGITYYCATDSVCVKLPAMTDATIRGATYTIVNLSLIHI